MSASVRLLVLCSALLGGLALGAFEHPVALAQESAMPSYQDRSEVPDQYTWDLEDIYADDAAWEKDFLRLERMIPDMAAFRDKLQTGTMLLGALEFRDHMNELYDRLLVYAHMRHHEDTRVEAYTALRDRINSLGVKRDEALSWFDFGRVSIVFAAQKRLGGVELLLLFVKLHQFLLELGPVREPFEH